jgi:hypothetical protein
MTDEDGFRNSHVSTSADILIIGDSYAEYGDNEDDTFGKRLEKKLPGLTVANLGKSGYGPFQYLEVLKRYGVNKKPRFMVLAIFEGNDLGDIEDYLKWQEWRENGRRNEGTRVEYQEISTALTGNILQRYRMAFMGTLHGIIKQGSLAVNLLISKIWQMRGLTHPDIAVVNVGNKDYDMLLLDIGWSKKIIDSPENLLRSRGMSELRSILEEFKRICEMNQITAVVLYIPTRTHIYAEYSTMQSGSRWLEKWRERVRNKGKIENVIMSLLNELSLEPIDLSPIFEQAAKRGKMVSLALDSHWNAEGREMAASTVAEVLKEKLMRPSASE